MFDRKYVGYRNEKNQICINQPVYLGLSTIKLSKAIINEFWYDYVKPKYGEKAKLCNLDTNINKDDIYKDIAENVETRFDTSNYDLDRPLPKRKNKKVIGLMKDDLERKVMIKFVELSELRAKPYSYFIGDSSEDKKARGTKKCHKIKT